MISWKGKTDEKISNLIYYNAGINFVLSDWNYTRYQELAPNIKSVFNELCYCTHFVPSEILGVILTIVFTIEKHKIAPAPNKAEMFTHILSLV